MPKTSKKHELKEKKSIDISFNLNLNKPFNAAVIAILLLLTITLPLYYVYYSYETNNSLSFPLDDSWIHLQFAKNLAEYGSFSYFKNEQVTAGSSSPIYTIIEAAGFLITKNEFAISYVLGIGFFALAVYFFFMLAINIFTGDNWLAIAAALLLAIDKRINLIAVSGMETTLYIFLLILCFYYYRKRNAAGFSVSLGLTLWTRPDALIFIAAVIADYLLLLYLRKRSLKDNSTVELFDKKSLIKTGIISGSLAALYFVFNFLLSGSMLPNTYEAKLSYYSPLVMSRTDFLSKEVWHYFTDSAYILLIIPFAAGVIKLFRDLVNKKYNPYLLPVLFIFGLIFIYWLKLPFAHRFGRYLMPLAPFYILTALYGTRIIFTIISEHLTAKKIANALNVILIIAAVFYFSADYYGYRVDYQSNNRHIYLRHVITGKWLKNNTPESSIVAAHDVGAIAFYSDRKILDIVGLINPEFSEKLNDKDYSLFVENEIKKQNVSYLAFINDWCRVANQPALFTAGENNYEIMEVYRYDPLRTHILRRDINELLRRAFMYIQQKQFNQANELLLSVLPADTNSSATLFYLGYTSASLGNGTAAEKYLKSSLLKFPEYRDAAVTLSRLYESQKRIPEALNVVTKYLELVPGDTTAAAYLKQLNNIPGQ